jgi:hypothetical protein
MEEDRGIHMGDVLIQVLSIFSGGCVVETEIRGDVTIPLDILGTACAQGASVDLEKIG